jgi:hypothetical protein
MPITYRIDHEIRLVIARGYGTLTDDDIFGYQRDVSSREDARGYNALVDMTDVSEIKPPSAQRVQDLAAVAAQMDAVSPPSRFAIVAPGDLAFGLGRMFQVQRELQKGSTREVRVFRILSDALAFLKIDHAVSLPPLPQR